jgi:hypothetical protein
MNASFLGWRFGGGDSWGWGKDGAFSGAIDGVATRWNDRETAGKGAE